jgi:hypothetical protein
MKLLFIILFSSGAAYSQDSVQAKVMEKDGRMIRYKVNKMMFVSYCNCDSIPGKKEMFDALKRGSTFMIPKSRFDSLLLDAKPVRRRNLQN